MVRKEWNQGFESGMIYESDVVLIVSMFFLSEEFSIPLKYFLASSVADKKLR